MSVKLVMSGLLSIAVQARNLLRRFLAYTAIAVSVCFNMRARASKLAGSIFRIRAQLNANAKTPIDQPL